MHLAMLSGHTVHIQTTRRQSSTATTLALLLLTSGQIAVRCSGKATWADSTGQQGHLGKSEVVLMCSVRQKVKIQADGSTPIILLPQTVI